MASAVTLRSMRLWKYSYTVLISYNKTN